MKPYIFNIQKFSLHDGPGIRTTVFFKGCPLRCHWCHNPESQAFEPEGMIQGSENSEDMAQNKAHKEPEGASLEAGTGISQVGELYSVRELVKLLKKDQIFYDQSGGGVTLSGGEVMAQDMEYVLELVRALDREGISVVIDTSGYAKRENFEQVLPFTELFLYDLKAIGDEIHREYTGVSNERILENLKYLSDQGAKIELRMIMVKGINMDDVQIEETADWLLCEQIKVTGITLLPYHDFGRDKYRRLGRKCTQKFEKPLEEDLNKVKQIFQNRGFSVKIHN